MEQYLRDYHTRRIIADLLPFEYNGKIYYITSPTAEFRFYAEKVYKETYERAKEENLLLYDNIIVMLDKYKVWSEEEENRMATIKKELDDTKVNLFENYFRDEKRTIYKKIITDLNDELNRLTAKKHSMDSLTAEHSALMAKQRFLIGSSILLPNKKRMWKTMKGWERENKIIETAFIALNDNFLYESGIRELIKNEPWRSIWSLHRKPQSIFRKSIGDFNDEQQSISLWSVIYDNIQKSTESPSAQIMDDDDALDGWIILQKRKNDTKQLQKEVGQQIDEKVSASSEVFVIANSVDQAKKIYEMNDFAAKVALKKRLLQVQQDKYVDEVNMRETRERIIMQSNEIRGRK